MAQRQFAEIDVQLLQLLKKHRFEFNIVYDVGSSNGSWSWHASQFFPEAHFHLFEPLVA